MQVITKRPNSSHKLQNEVQRLTRLSGRQSGTHKKNKNVKNVARGRKKKKKIVFLFLKALRRFWDELHVHASFKSCSEAEGTPLLPHTHTHTWMLRVGNFSNASFWFVAWIKSELKTGSFIRIPTHFIFTLTCPPPPPPLPSPPYSSSCATT